ncbi:Dynein heavy chain 11, axonemal [Fukomys damarensis]|uniref:Dynein axonemal heavy chain 11 n=1 Tax=Fukomys damarensis TaxID=885580 RepID=A0A091DTE7_FUKDA|nr:Dynein heavy chain 11, axonemal [Fukomys damarensis]
MRVLQIPDARVRFLGCRLQQLLGLREETWSRYLESEDNRQVLSEFLERCGPACLVFSVAVPGQLAASREIPRDVKHKLVYVAKKITENSGVNDFSQKVLFEELPVSSLGHVTAFLDELQAPVVLKMVKILKSKQSSYFPTLKNIFLAVEDALLEAQDVELHLRPLRRHIHRLQETEFPHTCALIAPLFHTICLIWSHSKFYNTPARVIVLLQEFCNLFIDQDIFVTMLEFEKLERLEFGGTKGAILNEQIHEMSEEFMDLCKIFKQSTYNPSDYDNMEFENDYVAFKSKILDFNRRLGTVLCEAFYNCHGLEAVFKLLTIFGNFLEKPVVMEIFSPHYSTLVNMFNTELDVCKQLYNEHIKQKYIEMTTLLDQFENHIYNEWKSNVDEICEFNLNQPLVKFSAINGLLSVNFDPKYIGNLELLVRGYNKLKQTLLEVEYPLIEDELGALDEQLSAAVTWLTWQDDCWEYLEKVQAATTELGHRVEHTQSNVLSIQRTLRTWAEGPLLSRRELRREAALTWEDKGDLFAKKYKLIQEDGHKIHNLVEENRKLLKANPSLDAWKIYVEFIDDIVVEGFFQAIMHDLDFFLMNTEKQLKPAPFFQAQMILMPPEIVFKPPLEREAGDGIYDLVEEMLCSSFRMSAQMKRVAAHLEITNYQNDMDTMLGLAEARQEIMNRVGDVITKVMDFRNSLETYAYLWVDDRVEFMRHFLLYGHTASPEEMDTHANEDVPEQPPTLEQFKEQARKNIDIYEALYVQMSKLDDFRVFNSWFKVDMKRFKVTLLNVIKKWSWMFQEHLLRFVIDSLNELQEFMKDTDAGLQRKLSEGDHDGLVDIMGHLLAVRSRQRATDELFEPLKETITLLESYGQKMPEQVYAQLEEKQAEFRERFRSYAPLGFNAENPYTVLDKANKELKELEEEMLQMQDSARLFEVALPEYKQMKQCRKEIRLLKGLWDVVVYVREIWSLDKAVRVWDAYAGLEGTVKDMTTFLRAISELQSPALRNRHWHQLMKAIGVTFSINEATTLADLLALQLHRVEDEVQSIVDKAVKELGTEKVITEISQTWATMEFSYEVHYRTSIPLLKSDEQLLETLEHNQVQLQTVLQSKYVEYFIEQVLSWQNKLNIADSVIFTWMEVQRTWSHLESIFACSEDIQIQLVEDTRRFYGVDAEFKELMFKTAKTKNVLEATCRPHLYEKLKDLQYRLSLCEKALAEYLETKRVAFPRFYFISSADLLDILSKGAQPKQVTHHLAKLFDSIADLQFEDDQDVSAHRAVGMYSKEKEHVSFRTECECRGHVETWLLRLERTMKETVRQSITEAIAAYEEKPRELWIFDFPAQVALTSSQIWWTTDVGIAFSRLEEGYETALKDFHKKQVVSPQAFTWLSQLRHQWEDTQKHCFVNICDAQFQYFYEYLGNSPRLVITPLTDRCYITLTQSLHLTMSGAPAGPAGTGKTETTKDLGRALGMMVYVFNCSEQMDYRSIGNIYKGLVQTGAWGCFDEFNRIAVEVLSVVAVQVKTIHDAIRNGRKRPCAMVAPDIELICEIMLVAEGFVDARSLARKFISLYTLCKELLSKQDHYDWGLRAVKSVLVVAGSLKRGDKNRPEDQVLMRALRDFNMPKIVTDDVPVFLGLVGDLFPALDVPRRRDTHFEQMVRQSTLELRLQPEDSFILKVVQLEELLAVRHSVFVVGNAGTGKSKILRTLNRTYVHMKQKPVWNDLNPKAVTTDELFGFIHHATREWKDGKEQANLTHAGPKWIVLDGDVDPMWIESLNTVMDDNKVLTLASNERVALTPSMRLLFEIHHLRTATPATVSRAGILYVNPQDLGWNPYVASWIDRRQHQSEKANLTVLFDKYIPACLDKLRTSFKTITPIPENSLVQTVCALLDCLLTPENVPSDSPKEVYEVYFVFACIWAFGGTLLQDQLSDDQADFSRWWHKEMKAVKFPSQGTIFDYYLDHRTKKFLPWADKIPQLTVDPDAPLQTVLVHTSETTRLRYFIELLLEKGKPLMLVGNAGVGKTIFVDDILASLPEDYIVSRVPLNYYTTSAALQRVLEKRLEKKAGRNYGPGGNKKLVYFIDDMNRPEVDLYGTVQPHTLMRQHIDYGHWYDRQKVMLKEIHNCQYVACMTPTVRSFSVSPRLQRHFTVFAFNFPSLDALNTIYGQIFSFHSQHRAFGPSVLSSGPSLIQATVAFHQMMTRTFLPTAVKFHYVFNLRDLSNVFQGILFASPECLKGPDDLIHLWLHESSRVYGDKLIDTKDCGLFQKKILETAYKYFEGLNSHVLLQQPLVYCHFAKGGEEPCYMPVRDWEALKMILTESLSTYNELNAAMHLVLFEDAMQHVCRISRILRTPQGHALLIGVGGSGKQSLSRLAAHMCSLEVFQITLTTGYRIQDLRVDLANLYIRIGAKNMPTAFLLTDAHVLDESFLVLINDLLVSGEIPDLFSEEDVDKIVSGVRNEVHALGVVDSRENCWKFFLARVRLQLKIILCFSPVGHTLRVRVRKFPAIVSCSAIDWFHAWPQEALVSVSRRFIEETEGMEAVHKDSISLFMAYVHTSVNEMSARYYQNERRHNYTTPKSFLEQISLFKNLLKKKQKEVAQKKEHLLNGIQKLKTTASQVGDLKARLASQEAELQLRNRDAEALVTKIGLQTEKVSQEKAIADSEEQKVAAIQTEVSQKQRECEADLLKAEPALVAATAALNTLNRVNLTELKAFPNPPNAVTNVTAAVMVLLAPRGRVPKDRSWKAARVFMGKVDDFLQALINYDKEHIPENCLKVVNEQYLKDPEFNPNLIRTKSFAAAGLCAWVINIIKFYEVYCDVEPKRQALAQANLDLAAATEKLVAIRKKLGTEKIRWGQSVQSFEAQEKTLCGDVLLTAAFVSYTGSFTKQYRQDLVHCKWVPFLQQKRSVRSGFISCPSLRAPHAETPRISPGASPLSFAFAPPCGFTGLSALNVTSSRMTPAQPTPPTTFSLSCLKAVSIQRDFGIWSQPESWKEFYDQNGGIKFLAEEPVYSSSKLIAWSSGQSLLRSVLDGEKMVCKGLQESESGYSFPDAFFRSNCSTPKHELSPVKRAVCEVSIPITGGLDVVAMLTDDATVATWNNEGLPSDRMSIENATILTHCERWPLMIDPQQQGMKWIKNKYGTDLKVTHVGEKGFLNAIETALAFGNVILVENLEETIDPVLDPLLGRNTIKKGRYIRIGDKECEFNKNFRLILHTKLANPHYKPELQAQTTLLNFTVTEDGLEAQLLAEVVSIERPDLEKLKLALTKHQNDFKIELKHLEDDLLLRLSAAEGSFLDDTNLVERLETTKSTAAEIELKAFNMLFHRAIEQADKVEDTQGRISVLTESLTRALFLHTDQALFEKDKLTFLSQMAFQAVALMEEFQGLDRDIEGSAKQWRKWVESECPEKEKLPQEWKKKSLIQKMIILRAVRPDRMTYALRNFVEEKLGAKYVERTRLDLSKALEESSPATPVFFILSPGVDALKDLEMLGKRLGFTIDSGKFYNVSLGQGQEMVAEMALEKASRRGHWVILQNVHLVAKWLGTLEKLLEGFSQGSHEDFRVFMSAESAPTPDEHIIPQGLLENSIKITNEPPTGMLANLHAALYNFNQEALEVCSKEQEFKSILFSLCYFHACVAGRLRFGSQGWSRSYPFNPGDLTICAHVLYNYLEANPNVPWEDLRYLFGEIMYGGHITDVWDRRLCRVYLEEFMNPSLTEDELMLAPGFAAPPYLDYSGYHQYIEEMLPPESPTLYGLHPNAEIEFLTVTSNTLFRTLLEMQPRNALGSDELGLSTEDKVKNVLDDILEKLPEEFNIAEIMQKTSNRSPYVLVCFQECERMNILIREIRTSLEQLELGLKGELTLSPDVEAQQTALSYDRVPHTWSKLASPSTYGLAQWFNDLLLRCRELDTWTQDLVLPAVVWLPGFFNPQSFLTAIMQSMARKNEWPLDRTCLTVDVTKKAKEDYSHPPREGAYLHGLSMEGARWDIQSGTIVEARLKELTSTMPVIFAKAIPMDRQETKHTYECPVYKNKTRGSTYIWTFRLKSKEKTAKWVLAGVALLLEA